MYTCKYKYVYTCVNVNMCSLPAKSRAFLVGSTCLPACMSSLSLYFWTRGRDSFICVTSLIHMCDATHSYACCDSFICVT